MARIFAPTDGQISKREKDHMETIRAIASQGMVLLENDGTLPLTGGNGKIALYGNGARRTVKGGIGSGDVNSRFVISVEQGFENSGFTVCTKKWLDEYDALVDQGMKDYMEELQEKAAKAGTHPILIALSQPFQAPDMRPIAAGELTDDTDTAVYVIARNAGEGADRYNKEGDYQLTRNEISDITLLGSTYEKLVVVLNVGCVIDTKELRSISGVGAVLLMSQAGNIGGDALLDVLTGKVTPSGKLTATWAENYEDYPSSEEFSHNNGELDDAYYTEGIYVGYRYFDTFDVKPAYCFGFGRSYTDFSIETQKVETDSRAVTLTVRVTNTGELYAGREVVQIYVSAPAGKLEKPYQELAAYKKTKLLAPGESQELSVSFPVKSMASYCEKCASWILEPGKYYVRVGNSSRNTKVAAALELDKLVKTEILKNLFGDPQLEETLSADQSVMYHYEGEEAEKAAAPVLMLEAEKIPVTKAVYQQEHPALAVLIGEEKLTMDHVLAGKASLEELVGQLTVEEMAQLCVGASRGYGSVPMIGNSSAAVPGAAGDTTSLMIDDRNIRNLILADGPAGLRLAPVFHSRNGKPVQEMVLALPGMDKLMGDIPKPDLTGTTEHYQYCTAIPIAALLAQTWDYEAIEKAGSIVGAEMEEFGVSLWLAPGMNIHRNPLCGRNFEYYSEDPLVAGMCAAADTEGVQSHCGVGTTIKHFAVNNQEDNRNFNNSHVSERAMREIYLKGFEICIRQSQPMSIMSSYNLLNGTHTANNYDLLTAAARDEWGFKGFVMTDWGTTGDGMSDLMGTGQSSHKYGSSCASGCIKAGNDLTMPGSQADVDNILAAVDKKVGEVDYPVSLGNLQWCACNILRVLGQSSSYEGAKPYGEQFSLERFVW